MDALLALVARLETELKSYGSLPVCASWHAVRSHRQVDGTLPPAYDAAQAQTLLLDGTTAEGLAQRRIVMVQNARIAASAFSA